MFAPLAILFLSVGQVNTAKGLEQSEDDKVQLQRWQKYYSEVATQYEVTSGVGRDTKLQLYSKPVLNYYNAVSGAETYGSMFVWTHNGRPGILGAIWSKRYGDARRIVHSFHSLSVEPVSAHAEKGVLWSPKSAGITPLPISEAPKPGDTPQQRLAQIRSLARDFSASTVRDVTERELRLLAQPIYRFDKPEVDRDGGLFMWMEDWDPELALLIETRSTPDGPQWHASFARFTNLPVTAKHKGREVWHYAPSAAEPSQGGAEQRYISVHGIELLPHLRDK
jgi:hypothetical protein